MPKIYAYQKAFGAPVAPALKSDEEIKKLCTGEGTAYVAVSESAINAQVVAKIRERYSVDDEIKMLRIAPAPESAEWNDYVESCLEWGRCEKAKLGLKDAVGAVVVEAPSEAMIER